MQGVERHDAVSPLHNEYGGCGHRKSLRYVVGQTSVVRAQEDRCVGVGRRIVWNRTALWEDDHSPQHDDTDTERSRATMMKPLEASHFSLLLWK